MNRSKLKVTIVVPTLNGGVELKKCLEMIYKQKFTHPFEVVVIDSGSNDGTVNIVQKYPVRLYQINKKDFNHGLTRQGGVELARGDYIAFLAQDAIPYDENWLSSLVESLEHDEKAAGAYSRQIPKPGCDPIAKARVENWIAGSDEKRIKHIKSRPSYDSLSPWDKRKFIDFDNVSSCVKKSIMKKFPYSKVEFGEDLEWSKRVLEAGYKIVYEPKSKVYHSHVTSILVNYKRAYIDHKRMKNLLGVDFHSQEFMSSRTFLIRCTLHQIKDDFQVIKNSYLSKFQKIGWMLYAIPMEFIEKIGMLRGSASEKLEEKEGSRKRIVLVSHDFPPDHSGGVSVITYNLAQGLSKNNEVFVFYRKSCKEIAEYAVQSETYEGLSVTSINNNFSEKPNSLMTYKNTQIDKAFRKFLAEKIPDIVHFQFLGAGLSTGMVAIAKEYKIPTVLTLNDYWSMCPRGQMMSYKWELCSEVIEEKCASCVFGPHAPISALEEGSAIIDLLGTIDDPILPKAALMTIDPSFVTTCSWSVNDIGKYVLLEHPPSEVCYRVHLPQKSSLRFSLCMPPETWQHKEGEGLLFEIMVAKGDKMREKIFSRYVDPKHKISDRKWHDCRVDLSAFGEKTVDLIFTTSAGPKGDIAFCAAGWGELRIVVEEASNTDYGIIDLQKKKTLIKKILNQAHSLVNQVKMIQSNRNQIKRIRERKNYIVNMLNKIDLLIAPSNFLREKFLNYFCIPEDKIIFSNYGINTENVEKSQRHPTDKLILGYLGTLMPTKGIHIVIDAFVKIHQDKAELKIYGEAPNRSHLAYIELIKRKIEGKNNVKIMGKYEREQLPGILKELDILVVPSIWHENSPLTIQEAFIAGVPVITSNIGGMAELVSDKVDGLHFKVGDSKDLYRKIMMLIENPGLIRKMSANAPSIKSIEEKAQELESIYEDLIASARANGR